MLHYFEKQKRVSEITCVLIEQGTVIRVNSWLTIYLILKNLWYTHTHIYIYSGNAGNYT